KINSMGAKNVVIKGGHMKGGSVTDLVLADKKFYTFSQKRLPRDSHGGGCVFSAALCVSIAKGKSVPESVRLAQNISFESIKNASAIGKGIAIARQKDADTIEKDLAGAIGRFASINGIHRYIPEVQTNFVYAKPSPKSILDILGLEGRIVRAGSSVIVAGMLKYGGSRHVASAVLEMTRKFPSTRSAVNIRYDNMTIKKATAKRFQILHYDRTLEPRSRKNKEGKTVSWGIKNAIKNIKSSPDMIYHTGDLGKEPMILLFGKTPRNVLTKLAKIR
ncbi:MAG: bifunctional hydroxymethylpyrimidine kinase/phosphomethylpyrimidine kinase, partial [Patescibacteria group bacterium]|nr:bifunctional hydroxymethylpyrimidine kinase/phosphomethylpyrimidine kinase [Patescibacteria group bacterium]